MSKSRWYRSPPKSWDFPLGNALEDKYWGGYDWSKRHDAWLAMLGGSTGAKHALAWTMAWVMVKRECRAQGAYSAIRMIDYILHHNVKFSPRSPTRK